MKISPEFRTFLRVTGRVGQTIAICSAVFVFAQLVIR